MIKPKCPYCEQEMWLDVTTITAHESPYVTWHCECNDEFMEWRMREDRKQEKKND